VPPCQGLAYSDCGRSVSGRRFSRGVVRGDAPLPCVSVQNAAMFFGRQAVDTAYGGLAFEEEGERCAALLGDPKTNVLVMGNHGIMVIGQDVAETFTKLYYFERAAQVYINALQTGRPLRILPDDIAAKTALEIEDYPEQNDRHLAELKAILDEEGSNYAS